MGNLGYEELQDLVRASSDDRLPTVSRATLSSTKRFEFYYPLACSIGQMNWASKVLTASQHAERRGSALLMLAMPMDGVGMKPLMSSRT